jgi:hypothetical protein
MGKSGVVAGFCRGGRLLPFGRSLTRLDRCLAERSIYWQTVVWMEGVGTFGEPNLMRAFGIKQGWDVGRHLRAVVDINGDGKADIIGFGNDTGSWVVQGNGDGTFQPASFVPPAVR